MPEPLHTLECPANRDLICLNKSDAGTIFIEAEPEDIHWFEIVILFAVLIGYVVVIFAARRHKKKQTSEEIRSAVLVEADRAALDLLKFCVPNTSATGSHQFRGMRPKTAGIELEFEKLGLDLNGSGKCVLDSVTGNFEIGHMAAVMGPSGAGKTTFMNVLCGKATYGKVRGCVRVNGRESGGVSEVRPVMGFVPQDDVVHEELTVREQVYYSAQLRNPHGTSASRIDRIVEDVLAVMQLGRVQNTVVGGVESRGVSGGQRKRVNIGLELAACPIILFLDEPTSGLDATTSLGIVACLKKLTELGMTVVMSIHQPRYSLFNMFDEVLLLGVGGHTVFLGPSGAALPYFKSCGFKLAENENPADWIMDVISGSVRTDKVENFKAPMLSEWWEQYGGEALRNYNPIRRLPTADAVKHEREQSMEEKWRYFDVGGKHHITKQQLFDILVEVYKGEKSSWPVVDEIASRMGCSGGRIEKGKFTAYLFNLEKSFAPENESSPLPVHREASQESSSESSGSDEAGGFVNAGFVSGIKRIDLTRPGCFAQYFILLHRNMLSWQRNVRSKIVNIGLIILSAFIFGSQSKDKVTTTSFMCPFKINLSMVAIGLMTAISCLGVFGRDRPVFWREASSGINRLAFFFARATISLLDVWTLAFIYSVVWYMSASPPDSFWSYNECFRMMAFTTAGIGYLISTLVSPVNSTLAVSVVILLLGGAIGEPQSITEGIGKPEQNLPWISPFLWASGWCYLRSVDLHGGPKSVVLQGRAIENGYRTLMTNDYERLAPTVLTLYFVAILFISYLSLWFRRRDKQV